MGKFLDVVNKEECNALPGDVLRVTESSESDAVIDHRFIFLKMDGDYTECFKVHLCLSLSPPPPPPTDICKW